MPSHSYDLFREAILGEKQVTCVYRGRYRELCPVIVGHSNGQERAFAYQFGGESASELPAGGEWRCLSLADVRDATLRDGPWHEGTGHSRTQTCVVDVDLDINVHVRRRR